MRLKYSILILSFPVLATALSTSSSNNSNGSSNTQKATSTKNKQKIGSSQLVDTVQRRQSQQRSAPLVDSTLLRFISSQKKIRQDSTSRALQEASAAAMVEILQQTIPSSSSPFSSDPWMGQFNRNRVASKLIACKVDPTVAQEAGEQVQQYVLTKTVKRRIRQFLRQRDTEWKGIDGSSSLSTLPQSSSSSSSSSPSSPTSTSAAAAASSSSSSTQQNLNNVDNVIDLFLECGLTGNDIACIFKHTPSVAVMRPRSLPTPTDESNSDDDNDENNGNENNVASNSNGSETLQETMERSFHGLLLDTLKLRKNNARRILRTCPGLLTKKGSKSAKQVIGIMTKLGVSTNSIAREFPTLPTLLSRSPADIFRLISFLASDAIRMPTKNIGPVLRRQVSDELLDLVAPSTQQQQQQQLPLDATMAMLADGNTSNEENNNNENNSNNDCDSEEEYTAAKEVAVSTVKAVLTSRNEERQRINDLYRIMSTNAWTLRHELGTRDLGKVISSYPSILLLDATNQILSTADYLTQELGIWEADLPRILQDYPAVFGMDPSTELQPVVDYLLSIGVQKQDLGSIFGAFPKLFTYNIENEMKPVVRYLREVIGIADVGNFVTRLPPVLGYSIPLEIIPKWKFLKSVHMYPLLELERFPAYFSYPYERIIRTRYEYLQSVKRVPTRLVSVSSIVRLGDKDFAMKIARDVDNGAAFANFVKSQNPHRRDLKIRAKPPLPKLQKKKLIGRKPTKKEEEL